MLKTGNGRGFAIVITVGNKAKALELCIKELRFEKAPKVVDKYWEAGPGSMCMICLGISHDQLGGCKERSAQYVICTIAYKSKNHKY